MKLRAFSFCFFALAQAIACSSGGDAGVEEAGQLRQPLRDGCVSDLDCSGDYCGMSGECQAECGLWSALTCGSGTCRPGHDPREYCAVGAHCGPIGGDIQNLTCKRDIPCSFSTDCDPLEYCDSVLNTCQY